MPLQTASIAYVLAICKHLLGHTPFLGPIDPLIIDDPLPNLNFRRADDLLQLLHGPLLDPFRILEPLDQIRLLANQLHDLLTHLLNPALIETHPRLIPLPAHVPFERLYLLDLLLEPPLSLMHPHLPRELPLVLLAFHGLPQLRVPLPLFRLLHLKLVPQLRTLSLRVHPTSLRLETLQQVALPEVVELLLH